MYLFYTWCKLCKCLQSSLLIIFVVRLKIVKEVKQWWMSLCRQWLYIVHNSRTISLERCTLLRIISHIIIITRLITIEILFNTTQLINIKAYILLNNLLYLLRCRRWHYIWCNCSSFFITNIISLNLTFTSINTLMALHNYLLQLHLIACIQQQGTTLY